MDADILASGFAEAAERIMSPQQARANPADSVAAQLIQLAKAGTAEIFQDQYHIGYARIMDAVSIPSDSSDGSEGISDSLSVDNGGTPPPTTPPTPTPIMPVNTPETPNTPITAITTQRIVALKSLAFRWWLARQYHVLTEGAAGKDAITSAVMVLEAEAQLAPVRTLYVRCAPDGEGGIWIDAADSFGNAIHVTHEGWKVEIPPPIFRRHPHMNPLATPKLGGRISKILDYTSLKLGGDQLLAIVKLVTDFIPEVPMPNGVISGIQGSGKTTFHKLELAVVDPSNTDLTGIPSKDDDLIQYLEHHYLSIFDNVSSITDSQSNIFCRAITGGGREANTTRRC